MAGPGGYHAVMPFRRNANARRLIFPLIIIAVAVGLGVWSTQSGSGRNDAVERFVRRLCTEIAAGEEATLLLGRTDATVAAGVRQQIRAIAKLHGENIDLLDVNVIAGDINPHPGSETATHSVLLRDGDVELLGLRVSCRRDASAVSILGYWLPHSP